MDETRRCGEAAERGSDKRGGRTTQTEVRAGESVFASTTFHYTDGIVPKITTLETEGTRPQNFGATLLFNGLGHLTETQDARGLARAQFESRLDGAPLAVTVAPTSLELRTQYRPSLLGEDRGHTAPMGDLKN